MNLRQLSEGIRLSDKIQTAKSNIERAAEMIDSIAAHERQSFRFNLTDGNWSFITPSSKEDSIALLNGFIAMEKIQLEKLETEFDNL